MNKRTITGIATAAALTAAGISVTNNLKKVKNPSEGLVQAATVQGQAQTPQQQFLNKAIPAATASSSKYGTYTSVMIAQAAIESGWGQSSLSQSPNNNLFGIKGSYNGQSVNMNTAEYGANGRYTTNAGFRKYPSYTESFNDNGALLRNGLTGNNGFYSGTWVEKANSGVQATQGLQGKYATAPNYAASLNSVIRANGLDKYDPTTQVVNETRTVQQTAAIMNAPVDVNVGTRVGTVQKGQQVAVGKYITYGNGVKYAYLTNANGWLNAAAFTTAVSQAPVQTNVVKTQAAAKPVAKPAAPVQKTNTLTVNVSKVSAPKKVNTNTFASQKVVKLTPKQSAAAKPVSVKEVVKTQAVKAAPKTATPVQAETKVIKNNVTAVPKKAAVKTTAVIKNNTEVAKKAAEVAAKPVQPSIVEKVVAITPVADSYNAVKKVIKIKYVPNYGVAVWNAPGQKTTGDFLPHGSSWKVTGQAFINGHVWYKVGLNRWVDSRYTENAASVVSAPVAATNMQSGIVTVNWRDNEGVTVWNMPGGHATGKYLKNDSSWRFFKSAKFNGEVWYNLGGNQWVPAKYVYVR